MYIHVSKGETSSTSILQALSFGLPTLCSNIEGNRNLLKYINKIPNLNFTFNSEDKIFENIKKLFENKKIQNQMRISSQKSIKKFFNSERMVEKYIRLIEN